MPDRVSTPRLLVSRAIMAAPFAPPVSAHHFAPPTEADVRHALWRHFGPDEATRLWDEACRHAGIRRTGGVLLPQDLAPIAEHLASQEGVLRAIGQSLRIRLRTHRVLAARGG